ncbi:protein O-linked-mannose beta-1,2-N-acetylglucosaminyltransferase 1-like isoform X2 [Eriocheir sinensis]|uniref:protein O-linked-mannose beta-1,2-N-acetylglucosaminyltransferase 1-like isoform X2 n=1 Tax=Eriocheir sinensis TaxID=95602 RepID=UPI0021C71181|nr:protein O-linked-mannose beta-1,2-N-acetylglucosaminyltransferase 1-like isoform X2 [Eriocheir sinensis]
MRSASAPLCGVLSVLVTAVLTIAGYPPDAPLPASPQQTTAKSEWAVLRAWTDRAGAHTYAATQGAGSREEQPSAEPHRRGLYMTVLHQRTARVLARRVFLTEEPYTWWADLVWWLSRVAPGRVVLLAAGGRASQGFRHARKLLANLGSIFVPSLAHDTSWSWAFVKGGRTLFESVARGRHRGQDAPELSSGSVSAEGLVLLMQGLGPAANSPQDHERWHYCAAHGAMGGLCDEHSPDPLPPPPPAPVAHQAALANIPVVVTAGARHQYLYHTLTALLAAPGALRHNVLVVLGDAPQPTVSLLRLLGLKFTSVPVSGQHNDKLFRYYRAVFRLLERSFPDAPAAIMLDEDIEVSPDFFSFFSQTLWLLHADPSLYCINAYSHLPTLARGRGSQFVRRGAVQPAWGYAVTLSFVREALASWPPTIEHEDVLTYDYWLYDKLRRGREGVFPEVSRARHYGVGTNTVPFMHEYEAWHRPLLRSAHVPLLNAPLMFYARHENTFLRGLQAAQAIKAEALCGEDFPLLAGASSRPLVVYYVQEEDEDVTSWFELALCSGLHMGSEQGHHNGAHLAFYSRHPCPQPPSQHPLNAYGFKYYFPGSGEAGEADYTRVYLVGVPHSRYASLRPAKAEVFDGRQLSPQQLHALRARFTDSRDILLFNVSTHNYDALVQDIFPESPCRHLRHPPCRHAPGK